MMLRMLLSALIPKLVFPRLAHMRTIDSDGTKRIIVFINFEPDTVEVLLAANEAVILDDYKEKLIASMEDTFND
ncbi:hypothetical protein IQ230_09725 [Gloeocapsopsis crepidinum LEGE 06123]|uniref:Uncharacterized protein n=1 Tax=Gloeocapsopsis crepidinum LEGE 06123 TaxID=588587 RepID=A0ABR9UQT2_9CHRO|nr:hypothetical protein [Gloeocapsopsis crepidinum]MBE9190635.1 hypothetical protein [Gloeocapsopsis crepidinum LEGE 06123]